MRFRGVLLLSLVGGCASLSGLTGEGDAGVDDAAKTIDGVDADRATVDGAHDLDSGLASDAAEVVTTTESGDAPSAADTAVGTVDGGTATDTGSSNVIGCNGAVDCSRIVFVTSATYGAAFGSAAGADAKCTEAAANATLLDLHGRAFVAWFSETGNAASARLVHGTKDYHLPAVAPSTVIVAADWTDLTNGGIANGISMTENGVTLTQGYADVWTGTKETGDATSYNCENWTKPQSAVKATAGSSGKTSPDWTNQTIMSCDLMLHLYCIEK